MCVKAQWDGTGSSVEGIRDRRKVRGGDYKEGRMRSKKMRKHKISRQEARQSAGSNQGNRQRGKRHVAGAHANCSDAKERWKRSCLGGDTGRGELEVGGG